MGVAPHRLAELLSGDVPLGLIVGVVRIEIGIDAEPHLLLGEAERFEHEDVSVEVVSPIVPQEFGDRVISKRIPKCSLN